MNINAVYSHKYLNTTLVVSFAASTQLEFSLALSAADDKAEKSFPRFSCAVETLDGDEVVLATWEENYAYIGIEQRNAENGCAKRWKLVDATGDEAGEDEGEDEYLTEWELVDATGTEAGQHEGQAAAGENPVAKG